MWDAYFYIIEDISLKLIKCILKKTKTKKEIMWWKNHVQT